METPIELPCPSISVSYRDRKPTFVSFWMPSNDAWQQVMRLLKEAGVDVWNEAIPTQWRHETIPDGTEYLRFDLVAKTTPVFMRVNMTAMMIPDARWISDLATDGVPVGVYAAYDIALYKRGPHGEPPEVPRERLNVQIDDRAALANLKRP